MIKLSLHNNNDSWGPSKIIFFSKCQSLENKLFYLFSTEWYAYNTNMLK